MLTTISLKIETKDKLKSLGSKGVSYEELVSSLIDFYIEEIKSRGDRLESGGSVTSN